MIGVGATSYTSGVQTWKERPHLEEEPGQEQKDAERQEGSSARLPRGTWRFRQPELSRDAVDERKP